LEWDFWILNIALSTPWSIQRWTPNVSIWNCKKSSYNIVK
jgi:hypothetical protein